ncbi:sulfotransferase domain-containing protein [Paraglaciecola arctica]|uniref:sulfotransferase domain-containing protein n=1 Tax=Paraglaciecola arctica TaxID=1128911 RepID=UPI001C07474D|nr:sulfotransferase domain-containing protein [Paraglaciecola arctica]MBU3004333.1 sulfotransferase domain-containing protein [Paraglaciecola arctica]
MSNYRVLKNLFRPVYEQVRSTWELYADKPTGHYPIVIQGIQRSGTNYLTTLLTQSDYRIINKIDPKRSNPSHKHFRWQKNKHSIVMDARYQNNRYVNSLQDINKICGYKPDLKHIVLFRTPEKWLNSIYRWGLESKWFKNEDEFFAQNLHIAYLKEWDAYYSFWQKTAAQTPNQVLLMSYERLIAESELGLSKIDQFMGVVRHSTDNLIYSVDKVRHSRPIVEKRTALNRPELSELLKKTTNFDWHTAMENSF